MKTKLITIIFLIGCIGSMMISCNNSANRILEETLNISNDQALEIENQFSDRKISIAAINPSENPIVRELDQAFEAYDVTSDDATQYLLIVTTEDKSYCAILDENLGIIDGAIDNTMFPINEMLKETLNIPADQALEIEKHFFDREISIASINPSENPIVRKLDQAFEAYDVTSDDATQYLLIVTTEDKSYCAILDENLGIIDGAIDNTMFPINEMLKETLNIPADQALEIEKHFFDREISIASINPSENPIVRKLDQAFEVYDIISDDTTQYLLIVTTEDKSYCAILDENLGIIDGAIDNTMFPSLSKLF